MPTAASCRTAARLGLFRNPVSNEDTRPRNSPSLAGCVAAARRFYDVNLRRGCYTPELVRELLALADAVKMNDEEAELFPDLGDAPALAVTRGGRGSMVRIGADRAECPGYPVKVVDTVGAGDAFAAAFLHGLGQAGAPRDRRFRQPSGRAGGLARGRGA